VKADQEHALAVKNDLGLDNKGCSAIIFAIEFQEDGAAPRSHVAWARRRASMDERGAVVGGRLVERVLITVAVNYIIIIIG